MLWNVQKMGADIATVPYNVFEQMMKHPLTDQGIEKNFQADYKAVFWRIRKGGKYHDNRRIKEDGK